MVSFHTIDYLGSRMFLPCSRTSHGSCGIWWIVFRFIVSTDNIKQQQQQQITTIRQFTAICWFVFLFFFDQLLLWTTIITAIFNHRTWHDVASRILCCAYRTYVCVGKTDHHHLRHHVCSTTPENDRHGTGDLLSPLSYYYSLIYPYLVLSFVLYVSDSWVSRPLLLVKCNCCFDSPERIYNNC